MCPRQELNPHQSLRSALFYPLNYWGDMKRLYRNARGPGAALHATPGPLAFRFYSIRPLDSTCLTSPINWVTGISRGQASVQLKTVRQRKAPNWSPSTARRSSAA